jgi:hypothetical protein
MMWGPIISVVSSVLDKVIPDNNAKEKAKADIEKALIDNAAQINLAQAETNKIEASHRSIWVAGWRPCLGWCAAAGFFGCLYSNHWLSGCVHYLALDVVYLPITN